MIKKYLLAPGPTPVPESGAAGDGAADLPSPHAAVRGALRRDAAKSLQRLFKTHARRPHARLVRHRRDGGRVTNTTSPGDRVLVVNGGKFGERWGKIAAAYGLTVTELKVEWGTRRRSRPRSRRALKEHPETQARPHAGRARRRRPRCIRSPRSRRSRARRDTLLVVDGITAVGVLDLPMDALGIDVLLTGSQKALMLPPGLAFIALSERAWKAAAAAKTPRFYFDLKRERDNQQKHTTAWTPAISLIFGLHEALRLMFAEGLDNVFARHDRLARATRAGAEALGSELVAPTAPSPATTGIFLPDGVPGKLVGYLRDKVGITFAGGQDQLKGKICRVAHLGYIGSFDIVTAMAALEMGIAAFGKRVAVRRGRRRGAEGPDGRHARRRRRPEGEGAMTYRVLATDPLDQQGVDVFTRAIPRSSST